MPFNFNFSELKDVKKIEINPDGWISPLYIEYGISDYGTTPSYFWRVYGTKHTFVIPIIRMQYLSAGDYGKHFSEILQSFREDYIDWSKKGFEIQWMAEYREMYKELIII